MEGQFVHDDFFERLFSGEKVVCPKCGKGIMLPLNPDVELSKNHTYYCSQCDAGVHWDPVVIVE